MKQLFSGFFPFSVTGFAKDHCHISFLSEIVSERSFIWLGLPLSSQGYSSYFLNVIYITSILLIPVWIKTQITFQLTFWTRTLLKALSFIEFPYKTFQIQITVLTLMPDNFLTLVFTLSSIIRLGNLGPVRKTSVNQLEAIIYQHK